MSPRMLSLSAFAALGASMAAAWSPIPTGESRKFLLIGMGPESDFGAQPGVGQAVSINAFEIGANKAPVPSSGDFLSNGSSGGPSLLGNVPNIPLNALPVFTGIGGDGNIAITHPIGRFNIQGVGIYADLGVVTADSAVFADAGTSNSFLNDTVGYPNTFTSTGPLEPGVSNNSGGFGSFISESSANPATEIVAGLYGVSGDTNFAPLLNELAAARAMIVSLPATRTWVIPGGTIDLNTTLVLDPGLNVIDMVVGGGDFLLSNANLVIDGPADSTAVFRLPDDANFLLSNANLLVGNSGIGVDNVLFFSNRPDNSTAFSLSSGVINGVSFWALGGSGGGIDASNIQGRTQFIADKVTLNQVRVARSAFAPAGVPCDRACIGDVSGDGQVGLDDLLIVLGNFGLNGATGGQGDSDCDGSVNLNDVLEVLGGFGGVCS